MLISIDPGSEYSALIRIGYDYVVENSLYLPNQEILHWVQQFALEGKTFECVVERITLYQAADQNLLDTAMICGAIRDRWDSHISTSQRHCVFVPRQTYSRRLLGTSKANDSLICKYLKDRFASDYKAFQKAFNVRVPADNKAGYRLKKDLWQALGLACYWLDERQHEKKLHALAGIEDARIRA